MTMRYALTAPSGLERPLLPIFDPDGAEAEALRKLSLRQDSVSV
jgi:hypothetical protein